VTVIEIGEKRGEKGKGGKKREEKNVLFRSVLQRWHITRREIREEKGGRGRRGEDSKFLPLIFQILPRSDM